MRVLSKPSPARRAAELREIDEAIADGRCHRISPEEAAAYDEAQWEGLPPRKRGFGNMMEQEARRARAARTVVQV